MSTRTPAGIVVRHTKACRTRAGARCNCSPTFKSAAYDKRSGIRIPEDSPPVTIKAAPMEVPYPKTRPITGEFARLAHDRSGSSQEDAP
jgi:hypothetical protein